MKLPVAIPIAASFASSFLHLKQIISAVWGKYLGKREYDSVTFNGINGCMITVFDIPVSYKDNTMAFLLGRSDCSHLQKSTSCRLGTSYVYFPSTSHPHFPLGNK